MVKDLKKELILDKYKEYTSRKLFDSDLLIKEVSFIGEDKKIFKNPYLIEIIDNKEFKTLTIYENGNIFNIDSSIDLIKDELYVVKLEEELSNGILTKSNYLKHSDLNKAMNFFSGNQFFKHFLKSFLLMDKNFDYKITLGYFNNNLKCSILIKINDFSFNFYLNHSGFFSFYSTINTPNELIESNKFILKDSYYFKHKNGHSTEVNITKFDIATISQLLLKEAGIELNLDIYNFSRQFKLINILDY